jgi:hypothetical protein
MIYSLYITRSRLERRDFYKIDTTHRGIIIVHLDFKYNDKYRNIRVYGNKLIIANVYYNNICRQFDVYNLQDLINIYSSVPIGDTNVFVYSGHSDGMYLAKNQIRILRIEDYCEMIHRVIGKKADLIIFDACLCGNIGCLNICKDYSKYVIADTSYGSYETVLYTDALYSRNNNFVDYCKNIINDFIYLEIRDADTYDTNICLYSMNDSLDKLVNLVLTHDFNKKKCFAIDYRYYKDIECCFNYSRVISNLLNRFVLFSRYHTVKPKNHPVSKHSNSSIPSKLLILLHRPKRDLSTKSDIFLSNYGT